MEMSQQRLAAWIEPVTHRPLGEIATIDVQRSGDESILNVALPFKLLPIQEVQWAKELGIESDLSKTMSVSLKCPQSTLKVSAESNLSGVKHCVAVASGKGGVGKSTVTVNLACALQAMGLSVGILDADIYGPSQGAMLGASEDLRPNGVDGMMEPVVLNGISSMSMAYLVTESTPMVWRGPMATGALMQLLSQTRWGALDVLLIDMPPGTGDIALTLAQKVPLSGGLVVTTPQNIALLDAKKGIEMFRKVNVPVLGILENMSMHVCEQCGHHDFIFGEKGGAVLAEQYDTSVLSKLPLHRAIREDVDRGVPTVVRLPLDPLSEPFVVAAQRLMAALSVDASDKGPVISIR